MIKVSLIAGSSQKVCSFAYVQRERRKKGCSRRIGETPLPSTPGVCSGLSLTRVDWNQTERESFVQISSTLTCPIAASWVGTVNLKFTLTLLIMPEIPSLLTVIGSIWVRFWFLRLCHISYYAGLKHQSLCIQHPSGIPLIIQSVFSLAPGYFLSREPGSFGSINAACNFLEWFLITWSIANIDSVGLVEPVDSDEKVSAYLSDRLD